jgi:uncharacterized protein
MGRMLSAFFAGIVFSVGLFLSGMADPAKVVGFFDLFGVWDPTLAFVMGGGLSVTALGYRWCLAQSGPVCTAKRQLPHRNDLDARLFVGSAIFGLGWGIAGYCPAPALVAGAAGLHQAIWFCVAMAAGMLVWKWVENLLDSFSNHSPHRVQV